MKSREYKRSYSEEILLRVKPAVEQFHAQKKGRSEKYPLTIRAAVLEAWDDGIDISRISKLLGINLSTISAWRKFLPNKGASRRIRSRSVKASLKELKIVPDSGGAAPQRAVMEMVQVHLPNNVVLKIPSQMVGLDLLKGLMSLGGVCS